MKHLQSFEISKLIDEIKEISYILEDEGYSVNVGSSKNRLSDKLIVIIGILDNNEERKGRYVKPGRVPNKKWYGYDVVGKLEFGVNQAGEILKEYIDRIKDIFSDTISIESKIERMMVSFCGYIILELSSENGNLIIKDTVDEMKKDLLKSDKIKKTTRPPR